MATPQVERSRILPISTAIVPSPLLFLARRLGTFRKVVVIARAARWQIYPAEEP